MWLLKAFARLIHQYQLLTKRLAAARRVLIFGIIIILPKHYLLTKIMVMLRPSNLAAFSIDAVSLSSSAKRVNTAMQVQGEKVHDRGT